MSELLFSSLTAKQNKNTLLTFCPNMRCVVFVFAFFNVEIMDSSYWATAASILGHNHEPRFQLLLWPEKGCFCPSCSDPVHRFGFVSGRHLAERGKVWQQPASCLNLRLKRIGMDLWYGWNIACSRELSKLRNDLTQFFHILISPNWSWITRQFKILNWIWPRLKRE